MSDILNVISSNLIEIFITVITGLVSYFCIKIKNLVQEFIQNKVRKEIVEETVKYVEQTCKNLSCEEKKRLATEKSLEILEKKKILVSESELEILIESTVNCL